MSASIIDGPPLDYTLSIKMDPDGLVTITARLTSDLWVRYATPRKPWPEHKTLLLSMPDIHNAEPEIAQQYLEQDGWAMMENVWLTSIDLDRLDLKRV
jgi:hypothetical protein